MQKMGIGIIATILIELAIFILVGNAIGLFPTLLFVIASALVGMYLLKNIGTNSIKAVQESIQTGQPPAVAVIHSFLTFIGSILLIVPGFLSTILGLLLIAPFTKKLFLPAIFYWLRKKMKRNQIIIYQK